MSIYVAPRAKAVLGPGAAAMQTQPMAPWVVRDHGLGRESRRS